MQVLVVPTRLPNLNDVIDAASTVYRDKNGRQHRGNAYQTLKKKWSGTLMLLARSQGFSCHDGGHFAYIFHETERRRDPSNVMAGGIKVIEDALQDAGLLGGDGWGHVFGIRVRWVHNKVFGGVVVVVTDSAPTEEEIDKWSTEHPRQRPSPPRSAPATSSG